MARRCELTHPDSGEVVSLCIARARVNAPLMAAINCKAAAKIHRDKAIGDRTGGPILLNIRGTRMDRHAEPRTTMRYDQARKNLDRRPSCILAAYMASGA